MDKKLMLKTAIRALSLLRMSRPSSNAAAFQMHCGTVIDVEQMINDLEKGIAADRERMELIKTEQVRGCFA